MAQVLSPHTQKTGRMGENVLQTWNESANVVATLLPPAVAELEKRSGKSAELFYDGGLWQALIISFEPLNKGFHFSPPHQEEVCLGFCSLPPKRETGYLRCPFQRNMLGGSHNNTPAGK